MEKSASAAWACCRSVDNGDTDWPFPNPITVTNHGIKPNGLDQADWDPAGIVMTSRGNDVTGNTITGNGSGVFNQVCDGTNVASDLNTFTGNTFVNNKNGISFYAAGACGATTVNATISGNSFDGGLWSGAGIVDAQKKGVSISATRPNDVVAECNWWGSAAGPGAPGASTISAGVDASPWSTAVGGDVSAQGGGGGGGAGAGGEAIPGAGAGGAGVAEEAARAV